MKTILIIFIRNFQQDQTYFAIIKLMIWESYFQQIYQSNKRKYLNMNIDEWTISRNTKVNYSWSENGVIKKTTNTRFTGNLYIILAILSNGQWFLLTPKNLIESLTFDILL